MIPLIGGPESIHRDRKKTVGGCQGLGEGEQGVSVSWGRFLSGKMKKCWRWVVAMVA